MTVGFVRPSRRLSPAFISLTDATDQSIPNNVLTTPLTWATAVEDALGMHAPSSANIIIPVGYGGLWDFALVAGWAAGGTGQRAYYFFVNGVFKAGTAHLPFAVFQTVTANSGPMRLADGDVITIVPYQNSGGPLSVMGTSASSQLRGARRAV